MRKKAKLLWAGTVLLGVLALLSVCALLFLREVNRSLLTETRQYLSEVAQQNTNAVQKQIAGDLHTLESIAFWIGEMGDIKQAMQSLEEQSADSGFKRLGLILPDGTTYASDGTPLHLGERDYFQRSLAGETLLTAGLIDQADNMPICVYSTPVMKNGAVAAVLFATHSERTYAAILDVPLFGGEGYAFLATRAGDVVLGTRGREHMWGGVKNLFSQLGETGFSQKPAEAEKIRTDMLSGASGVAEFKNKGETFFLSYTPVGVNDWNMIAVVSAQVVAAQSAHLSALTASVCVGVLLLVAALFATFLMVQRKNRQTLERLAFTDPLTGGSNWNGFLMAVQRTLQNSGDEPYAMLVFDIDKFKVLNDLFGHGAGNRMLRNIWNILGESLSPDEPFARVSADTFSILLKDGSDEEIERRVEAINSRVIAYCGDTTSDYMMTMSYGIYHIVDKSIDVARMNDRATIARRSVKGKHENYIAFYDDTVRKQILAEKVIENEMEEALEGRQFEMYLQPKYSILTRKIVGAEALVRWNHPTLGLIPPGKFIPLFEKNGFVVRVDAFMFDEVCDKLAAWMAQGITPTPLSLNISRLHLHNHGFTQSVIERARARSIPRGLIELELTESTVLDFDVGHLGAIMRELQDAGFLLAMDDFGAGYSSLNLLRHLPVDVLKLDGQFFDFDEDRVRSETVIADMVTMASHLNIHVVAEGVETKDQVAFLATTGCDTVQGYYFAKPMPVADFESLVLREQNEARADVPTS